jgi:hypothetical protein
LTAWRYYEQQNALVLDPVSVRNLELITPTLLKRAAVWGLRRDRGARCDGYGNGRAAVVVVDDAAAIDPVTLRRD